MKVEAVSTLRVKFDDANLLLLKSILPKIHFLFHNLNNFLSFQALKR